ncbi:phosphopantetheine-binding protein [Streptomyces sp. NPDC001137]|uniref:acyl carrier protein n=1 Tax=Streptomyces sp. NPDC001137 TaxID=3154378 RepID=UPI00331AF800
MTEIVSDETALRIATIRDIAADVFSVEPEDVERAGSFITDLEADSLLAIELVSQLEMRFDIAIDESQMPRLMTSLQTAYEAVAESAGW